MCHVVRAAELYPSPETITDQPGLQPPYHPIIGEFILYLGKIENGLVSLSNFRFLVAESISTENPTTTTTMTTISPDNTLNALNDINITNGLISNTMTTTTTSTMALTQLVNIPLGLIEICEIREIIHLQILCKNARSFKCTFPSSELCGEWHRRINQAIQPVKRLEDVYATAYSLWVNEKLQDFNGEIGNNIRRDPLLKERLDKLVEGDRKKQLEKAKMEQNNEYTRLGFDEVSAWRITKINEDFLCPSYPKYFIVPSCISDTVVENAARFRSSRRVPAVVWRHRLNGAVIARSSQPEVGWLYWRSADDEQLLKSIAEASHWDQQQMARANSKEETNGTSGTTRDRTESTGSGELIPDIDREEEIKKLLIMDARSFATAYANRARGGGYENPENYQVIEIEFMSLANIHTIRKSFQSLRNTIACGDQNKWLSQIEAGHWLDHISVILGAAALALKTVEIDARSVLVHCSDGWDRTPQIVATAELLLDPFYRTIQGFQILVQKEWLDFGHKFADRCGLPVSSSEDNNERSPIFLQWLDCVHQLVHQFPTAFEFTDSYLVRLAIHTYSNLFGTFLYNSLHEREKSRVDQRTLSVWPFLRTGGDQFRNQLYSKQDQAIWPRHKVSDLVLWNELYTGPNEVGPKVEYNVTILGETNNHSRVRNSQSLNGISNVLTPSSTLEENSDDDENVNEDENINEESNNQDYDDSNLENHNNTNGHVENGEVKEELEIPEQNDTNDLCLVNSEVASSPPPPPPLPPPPTASTSASSSSLLNKKLPKSLNFLPRVHSSQTNGFSTKSSLNGPSTNGYHSNGRDPCHNCENSYSPLELSLNSTLTTSEDFDLVDGLTTPEDDIQKSVLAIIHKYKAREEALKRELCAYRQEIIRLNSHRCSDKNDNDFYEDDAVDIIEDDAESNEEEEPLENGLKSESNKSKLNLKEKQTSRRRVHRYRGGGNSVIVMGNGSTDRNQLKYLQERSTSRDEDHNSSWDYVNTQDAFPTLWVPDHAVSRCTGCDTQFWLGRRKHHCRRCGHIFCADCSENSAPVPSEQLYDPVRVCSGCFTDLEPPSSISNTNLNPNNAEPLPTATATT